MCYRGAAKRALWLFVAPFCDTVPTWITSSRRDAMSMDKRPETDKQVGNVKNAARMQEDNTSKIHGHRK